jgi:hypothetical protein
MKTYQRFTVPILVLCLFLPFAGWAQNVVSDTSTAPSSDNFWFRHVSFLGSEVDTRYRYMDKAVHQVTDRDLQYKVSSVVHIDLIGEGVTYIQARGESGRSFTSSFDYTGVGMNKDYWSFNLKSLYLGQRIGQHLQAQAGGIEYDRGAGTEATYADNDAWLEGYRLAYAGAGSHGLPNKISVTVGYVGDFSQPNFIARAHRMDEENYTQVLASKKLGNSREISAEFDSLQNISYTREALHWQRLPLYVVDEAVVEAMARVSDGSSLGWSGSAFKSLDRKGRFRPGMFYSDMPKGIFLKGKTTIMQNGDTYTLGQRVGPTFRVTPFRDFELSLLGTSRLDNTPGPRYRAQVAFRYQFGSLLNRARL